jgi:hypothetical protein
MSSIDPDPAITEPVVDYRQQAGAFLSIMDEMAPQVGLDYSVDSLQRLDQFISEHFESVDVNMVGESMASGIGYYLGEVITRHLGGHWCEDGTPAIEGIGPLELVYPLEKVQQRFQNGKKDSLAWYYHGLLKKACEAGFTPQTRLRGHSFAPVETVEEQSGSMWDIFKNLFR